MGSNRVPTDRIPPIASASVPLREPAERPFFLPAGSFSSRPGSTLNSETDRECTREEDGEGEEERSETVFIPTQDNIILFESSTPLPSSRSSLLIIDSDLTPGQLTHTLYPPKTVSPLSAPLKPAHTVLLAELLKAGETDTIDSESDRRICKDPEQLLRELDNFRSNCLRYESQNEALRKEIQSCATDLRTVDKSKRKVLSENSKLTAVLNDYRSAMGRLGEVSEKLGELLETEGGERQSEDVRHMCNHLAGQIDILCSRYNRSRAMNDHLSEENEKMQRELKMLRRAHRHGGENEETAGTPAIRTKECPIDHYDDRLLGYQSRLSSGSTTYYSSGRASADDSKSPISIDKDSENAGVTPNNTPAVSFLAQQKTAEELGMHVRTRSSTDSGEEKRRKGKGSCSPYIRAYLKGTTRRPISPATALLQDYNFTLKSCDNTASSSRLAQTTVLKGRTGKSGSVRPVHTRKGCRV